MQEWYDRFIQLITAKIHYSYENTHKKSTFFPQATWAEKYNNKILFTSHHLY